MRGSYRTSRQKAIEWCDLCRNPIKWVDQYGVTTTLSDSLHCRTRHKSSIMVTGPRLPVRPCVSQAGVGREKHEPDKDGKCIYCDKEVTSELCGSVGPDTVESRAPETEE